MRKREKGKGKKGKGAGVFPEDLVFNKLSSLGNRLNARYTYFHNVASIYLTTY